MNGFFHRLTILFLFSAFWGCNEDDVLVENNTPTQFSNIYPQKGTIIYRDSITANWSQSVTEKHSIVYEVKYWDENGNTHTTNTKVNRILFEGLNPYTKYKWQVKAINEIKQDYREGDIWNFQTDRIPYPVLLDVDKDSVRVNTVLTIKGRDLEFFDPENMPDVMFGNYIGRLLLRTDNSLQVVVPLAATNFIKAVYQEASFSLKKSVTFYAYQLDKMNPLTVTADDTITVTGKHFTEYLKAENGIPTLTIDNEPVELIKQTNDSLRFIVKPNHGRDLNIALLGYSDYITNLDITPYVVDSIRPKRFGLGDTTTIYGKYLNRHPDLSVFFGSEEGKVIKREDNKIQIIVPKRAKLPIVVDINNKKTTVPSKDIEIVDFNIFDVSPKEVKAENILTIYGEYFGTEKEEITALFKEQLGDIKEVWNDSIKVKVITGSRVPLKLTVRDVTKEYSNFTIRTQFDITGSEPEAINGELFTINGEDFGSNTDAVSVTFHNGVPATVQSSADDYITVRVPNLPWSAVGTSFRIDIVDYNRTYDEYAYIPFNTTAVTPDNSRDRNDARIGENIFLEGIGYGTNRSLVEVNFNDVSATVNSVSNDKISVVVPAGKLSFPLELKINVNGTPITRAVSSTIKLIPFDLTSFSPAELKIGETLTITGKNLRVDEANTQVLIGSVPITSTSINFINDNQISIAVPNNATNNKVSVVVNSDTIQLPEILKVIDYQIKSSESLAAVHKNFTVTGINFGTNKDDLTVSFGDIAVAPDDMVSLTNESITVKVPPGAQKPFKLSKFGNTAEEWTTLKFVLFLS